MCADLEKNKTKKTRPSFNTCASAPICSQLKSSFSLLTFPLSFSIIIFALYAFSVISDLVEQ